MAHLHLHRLLHLLRSHHVVISLLPHRLAHHPWPHHLLMLLREGSTQRGINVVDQLDRRLGQPHPRLLDHPAELVEALRRVGDTRGTEHDVVGHATRLHSLRHHLVEEAEGRVKGASLATCPYELGEGAHLARGAHTQGGGGV